MVESEQWLAQNLEEKEERLESLGQKDQVEVDRK